MNDKPMKITPQEIEKIKKRMFSDLPDDKETQDRIKRMTPLVEDMFTNRSLDYLKGWTACMSYVNKELDQADAVNFTRAFNKMGFKYDS